MKKSKVYFIPVEDRNNTKQLKSRLDKIIAQSGLLDNIKEKEFVAVKLHFGEKGNDGYVKPEFIKLFVDKIKAKKAKPFLTDTNVLYKGMRSNAVDHLNMAREHGFTIDTIGAPIIIADGIFGENSRTYEIKGSHFSSIKAVSVLPFLDHVVCVTHCTGHMVTSYAGALKNIFMGFASRAGKQIQHSSIKPSILAEKCILCRRCMAVCPEKAICEKDERSFILQQKCIGCAECIIACKQFAIKINWTEDQRFVEEKMVEYAHGILTNIKNKVFFNFALYITRNCDCMEKSPVLADNIGILASCDPLAVDKACFDLILKKSGLDVFKKSYHESSCERIFEYAEKIGIGTADYLLEEIK